MKIKFDVFAYKRMEIDIPAHWMPFAEAWLANDEERTDEQWKLVGNHSWNEMIDEFLPKGEEAYKTEIYSVMKEEEDE